MHFALDIGPVRQARTGVGTYCYHLLKHMLPLLEDVQVTGFASGMPGLALGEELGGRINVRRLPVPARLLYKAWDSFGVPAIDTLIPGLNLYHATNYVVPPAKRARRVVTVHDLAFLIEPAWCSPKIAGHFRAGIRRYCETADLVLACSHATKNDIVGLLEIDPAKVRVTHEAAADDLTPMPPEAARNHVADKLGITGRFLLFVGTLEPRKNLKTLLDAFEMLGADAGLRLVLVGGRGWSSERLYARLESEPLADRVIWKGYVPQADLSALYSAAEAFVFPSHYEGFGLPVLEAMTCGCPVVASNAASLPEVAGDGALLCDPGNAGAFRDAIGSILSDAALRASLVERGKAQARKFTWGACAAETVAAYRSLV
ncbi:MAG: glycosyltransferase family 4 protein [Candidatus Hydrogenedentes bacterium]|nr:glycosyltransferase family 4 protein [Candidatus Hydrogenedentota bacterium]